MMQRDLPAAPLRGALGDLKADARQLVETIQHAAERLKSSRRGPEKKRIEQLDGRKAPGVLTVDVALQSYQEHECVWLENHHTRLVRQIQTIGHPLDEFLKSLVHDGIREGVGATGVVQLADTVRDWVRQLYALEQLELAMYAFYRAEVSYRAARLGLELALPPAAVTSAEAEGNRFNREGTNALFHLGDHLTEQFAALVPPLVALVDRLADGEVENLLGREATSRALASVLNAHRIFDAERYVLEQRMDTLPLPPIEASFEDSLTLLAEQLEFLGAQRQSRERGWHPEEPTRDIHAIAASFWLLYTQLASGLLYLTCRETRRLGAREPIELASNLRGSLYELLAQWMLHGQEVQRRLNRHER